MLGKEKNTFSIYKKEVPDENRTKEGNDPIMKIECQTEYETREWVNTVKEEIDKLESLAFSISYFL